MMTKKAQVTGVVLVLAIIGVIVGVIVIRQASSSASESSGTASAETGAAVSDDNSSTDLSSTGTVAKKNKKKTTTSSGSGSTSITSDPTSGTDAFVKLSSLELRLTSCCAHTFTAKYTLTAFAIGDWGTTVSQDSCCTRSSTYNDYDINAEDIVASILNQQASAASAPPKCILSHG